MRLQVNFLLPLMLGWQFFLHQICESANTTRAHPVLDSDSAKHRRRMAEDFSCRLGFSVNWESEQQRKHLFYYPAHICWVRMSKVYVLRHGRDLKSACYQYCMECVLKHVSEDRAPKIAFNYQKSTRNCLCYSETQSQHVPLSTHVTDWQYCEERSNSGAESAHCKGAGAYTVLPYCKGAPHSVRIECAAECWRAKTKLSPSFMFRDGTPPIASRPLKMAALEPINSVRVVSRTDRPYGCYHDRSSENDVVWFNTYDSGRRRWPGVVSFCRRHACGPGLCCKHNATTTPPAARDGLTVTSSSSTTTKSCLSGQQVNASHAPFKHLIGIMSTRAHRAQEERLLTWLPNVARPGSPLKPGLNFVFVLGKPARALPHRMVLDIAENMDRGKSPSWFVAAHERFQDADYIFKMDLDTGLCPEGLRKLLDQAANVRADYIGFIKCCHHGMYMQEIKQYFNDMQKFKQSMRKKCVGEIAPWMYMQGSFYGLSRKALSKLRSALVLISKPAQPQPEDMAMGALLFHIMRKPRVFSLDHLPGCSNYMQYKLLSGEANATRLLDVLTCPVVHLNAYTFKKQQLASKGSLCNIYHPQADKYTRISPSGHCQEWKFAGTGSMRNKEWKFVKKSYPDSCCRLPFDDWQELFAAQ